MFVFYYIPVVNSYDKQQGTYREFSQGGESENLTAYVRRGVSALLIMVAITHGGGGGCTPPIAHIESCIHVLLFTNIHF